jgi:hypothetical protein
MSHLNLSILNKYFRLKSTFRYRKTFWFKGKIFAIDSIVKSIVLFLLLKLNKILK